MGRYAVQPRVLVRVDIAGRWRSIEPRGKRLFIRDAKYMVLWTGHQSTCAIGTYSASVVWILEGYRRERRGKRGTGSNGKRKAKKRGKKEETNCWRRHGPVQRKTHSFIHIHKQKGRL